jgi:hypothetical protein
MVNDPVPQRPSPDSSHRAPRLSARIPFLLTAAGLLAVTAAVLAFVLMRDRGESDVYSEPITADNVDPWPLTVPSAELHCDLDGGITVTVEGTTYAVNGLAEAHGHPVLDPVWAYEQSTEEGDTAEPDSRVPVNGLINRALILCNEEMTG